METRIIVCGGVHFNDYEDFKSKMDPLVASHENVTLVSGHAKGADTLAEKYAAEKGIPIKVFPAEWTKYGKAAGPIRNRAMLDYAKEQTPVVAAFWNGESRGTGNMIKQAKKTGVEFHIFLHEPNNPV